MASECRIVSGLGRLSQDPDYKVKFAVCLDGLLQADQGSLGACCQPTGHSEQGFEYHQLAAEQWLWFSACLDIVRSVGKTVSSVVTGWGCILWTASMLRCDSLKYWLCSQEKANSQKKLSKFSFSFFLLYAWYCVHEPSTLAAQCGPY